MSLQWSWLVWEFWTEKFYADSLLHICSAKLIIWLVIVHHFESRFLYLSCNNNKTSKIKHNSHVKAFEINSEYYPRSALICAILSLLIGLGGSRIFDLIIRSPLVPGCFDIGIPRPSTTSDVIKWFGFCFMKLFAVQNCNYFEMIGLKISKIVEFWASNNKFWTLPINSAFNKRHFCFNLIGR